jgi:hypothetical protein
VRRHLTRDLGGKGENCEASTLIGLEWERRHANRHRVAAATTLASYAATASGDCRHSAVALLDVIDSRFHIGIGVPLHRPAWV